MARLVLVLPFLLLACGHKDDSVGGVSPEEDRMLNEAASRLDATPDNQVWVNSTVPVAPPATLPAADRTTTNIAQPAPQGNAQ